jgi:spore cortex biosynthesis protein YabQ
LSVSVANQANIFLMSVAGGIIAAFIYDLFRIRRRVIRACALLVHVEDLLYWMLAAVLFFITAYYSNDGEIRGYMFVGAGIGAVLYAFTFGRVVMKAFVTIISYIGFLLKAVAGVLFYPFRVMLGVFRRISFRIVRNISVKIRKIFKK